MSFHPLTSKDHLYAVIAAVVLAIVAALFALIFLRNPLGPSTVIIGVLLIVGFGLLAVLLYRLWELRSLDYWIDRDALRVLWAGETVIIPLDAIQSLDTQPVGVNLSHRWWKWPAGWVQPVNAGVRLAAYASHGPSEGLLVNTNRRSYLLTPDSIPDFTQAIAERQQFGAMRKLEEKVETPFWRQHWVVKERLGQALIVAGLLLGLLLLANIIWRFPMLPAEIPLHFNAAGVPDRMAARSSLFILPIITLLMWALNVVLGIFFYDRGQRLAAYLLWGNAILIQLAGLFVLRKLLELVTF
ncbi:MAG: DUF1648 domain-containing protein [Caldilineales bacterium]|nr:DUF1648 domain-containing protein [Caldilineales bacterium]